MKKLLSFLLLAIVLTAGCAPARKTAVMPRSEASARWAEAASRFYEETRSVTAPDTAEPYSIMVVNHGKVVFEKWYNGKGPENKFNVYSISKTVLAMAAGCTVKEGLLNVDDRVIDYFPDQLPAHVSDTLRSMKIRHLLTMTCGYEETPKLLSVFKGNVNFDWIREFFVSECKSIPGTDFYYNFFASYILSAIIQKVTGKGVIDYIGPRILEPLHITDMEWENSPAGICVGGWGMLVSTEDLAKLGQLLLQRGKWNGRRLLPAAWIDTMTSNLVKSKPVNAFTKGKDSAMLSDPSNDHSQGYGYYVWQGKYGTYRMEGMLGNYVIVHPQTETVLVVVGRSNMDQRYMDLIWKHFKQLL